MEEQDQNEPLGSAEACRREDVIADLIRRYPKRLTAGAVDAAAREPGSTRATVYGFVKHYRCTRTVSGLMAQTRGPEKGSRFLEVEREALILKAIGRDYPRRARQQFGRPDEQIRLSCLQRGLPPANRRTIHVRVREFDIRMRVVGDSSADAAGCDAYQRGIYRLRSMRPGSASCKAAACSFWLEPLVPNPPAAGIIQVPRLHGRAAAQFPRQMACLRSAGP